MTVNELALTLIAEQDEASDNDSFVTVVENWINDALDEFASAHDWKLFKSTINLSTVASQAVYELNEQIREVRAIRFIDSDEEIQYIDPQRLIGLADDLETLAKPRFWFYLDSVDGENPIFRIQLYATPDGIYPLQYFALFHPILDPLDSANIPLQREMIIAIKHRVRAYILFSDKDYDGADRYLQMFYAKVEALKARENSPTANHARMQVRDLSREGNRRLARLDPDHFH